MSKRIESSRTAIRTERDLSRKKNPLENIGGRSPSEDKSNSASDDATGLSISVSLRTDMRSFAQALIDVNESISLVSIVGDLADQLQGNLNNFQEVSGKMKAEQLTREAEKIENLYQRIKGSLSNYSRKRGGAFAVVREDAIKLSFVISSEDWENLEAGDLVVEDLDNCQPCVAVQTKKYRSPGLAGLSESSPDLIQAEVTVLSPEQVLNHLAGEAEFLHHQSLLFPAVADASGGGEVAQQALAGLRTWKETISKVKRSLRKTAQVLHAYNSNLTTAESRIMDSGLAAETAVSIISRISKQATSAVLAQANQNAARAVPLLQAA